MRHPDDPRWYHWVQLGLIVLCPPVVLIFLWCLVPLVEWGVWEEEREERLTHKWVVRQWKKRMGVKSVYCPNHCRRPYVYIALETPYCLACTKGGMVKMLIVKE